MKDDFNVLKKHLFDEQGYHFFPHQNKVYGVGKEMFHAVAKLLQESHVPLQQRMNVALDLSSYTQECSGRLLSKLEAAIATLTAFAHGLKGVVHQRKMERMEALIKQYAETRHAGDSFDEIHFVNAYYNKLAKEMGVKERPDPLLRYMPILRYIPGHKISKMKLKACKKHVLENIKPTQMAADLASEYRNRIEESLNKENIAEDNIGLNGFNKLQITMQALKPEYGDVPMHAVLEQPDQDNGERYVYIGRKQPIRTTRHFLKMLKQQEMISYDKRSKLVLGKTDEERMVMLDDMLWVKQGEGKHAPIQEFTASSLIKLVPEELLNTLKNADKLAPKESWLKTLIKAEPMDTKERTARLCNVIQHAHKSLDAEENIKEPLAAWLQNFVAIMTKESDSSWQAGWKDPVMLLAAALGQLSVLNDLLQAGGNINATDEKGRTGLVLAAQGGHADMVKALIERGADVWCRDHQGDTALIHAARQGKVDAVRAVLGEWGGRTIDEVGHNKRSALQVAAAAGHIEVVQVLLIQEEANIDIEDVQGRRALALAAEQNHVEVVKLLLTARTNTEARDKDGNTAFTLAAEKGHVEVVKTLLQAGANMEACNEDGNTALTLAAEKGHAEVVKTLLQAGANMEARNEDVNIALTLAAEKGHAKVVEALLKSKADRNGDKCSALMQAAREGLVAAAKVLIQHGVDGCEELIALATGRNEFEAQAAAASSQWWKAIVFGGSASAAAMEMAKNLLEAGADGATALLELAQQNAKTALHVLIKAGADKAKDAQGKTALMRAVEMTASENERDSAKGLQILKTLFEAGVDTEVRDNEGRTAEAYAERAAGLGNNKAFHFFLYEAGAQKNGSWAFWK